MARPTRAALALLAATALGCTPPPEEGPCDPGITGQEPCKGALYFPTGLAQDPEQPVLYAVNFNADLRYSGGAVLAIDEAKFERVLALFPTLSSAKLNLAACRGALKEEEIAAACCQRALSDPSIIECDEAPFVTSAVKVGNFAGSLRVQRRNRGGFNRRLWLPVRGDPSITYVDVTAGNGNTTLHCGDPNQGDPKRSLPSCDQQRITVEDSPVAESCGAAKACAGGRTCVLGRCSYACDAEGVCPTGMTCDSRRCVECKSNEECGNAAICDAGLCVRGALRPEPFGIALDEDWGSDGLGDGSGNAKLSRLLITHLLNGETTLIDAGVDATASTATRRPPAGTKVILQVRPSFFGADFSGRRGAYDLAPLSPGCKDSFWIATSRVNASLAMFRIVDSKLLQSATSLPIGRSTFALGDDIRGVAVQSDGARAFFVEQRPPSLFTMSFDPVQSTPGQHCRFSGPPMGTVIGVVPICQGPSHLGVRQWRETTLDGPAVVTRAYVTCSTTGQVAIVDPDHDLLVGTLVSGTTPGEVEFNFKDLAAPPGGAPRRAFVANFGASTISVLDLERGSATENRVIARIGLSVEPR